MTKRNLIPLMVLSALVAFAQLRAEEPAIDADCFKGWTLTGAGSANSDGSISVVGNGNDCTYWLSKPMELTPGGTYMIQFLCKSDDSVGGSCVTGPVYCNVDIPMPGPKWTLCRNFFSVPQTNEGTVIRLGQWHARAHIQYANLQISPVIPLFNKMDEVELGDGEALVENEYIFSPSLGDMGRTYSRPLFHNTATFNSNRWVFGKGSKVVYRFNVNGKKQLEASFEATVNYHVGGTLKVAASKDNATWQELGSLDKTGALKLDIPKQLFPADTIYVSMICESTHKTGAKDSDPGAFQVNRLTYKASLEGPPTGMRGTTHFVRILGDNGKVKVKLLGYGDVLPAGNNAVQMELLNTTAAPVACTPTVTLAQKAKSPELFKGAPISLQPNRPQLVTIPYEVVDSGLWTIGVALEGEAKYQSATDVLVPDFYSINYGEMLAESGGNAVWWASSGWKISSSRRLPSAKGREIFISAARNEAEAAQLVITPAKQLEGVKASVSDLKGGAQGGVIPASAVDLLKVYYHNVTIKTDNTGILGLWPDALPPIPPQGLSIPAQFNQPIWVRVRVPADAKAGFYTGSITLTDGTGWKAVIPLKVEVYGFSLPDTMTCRPAFGLNLNLCARYHKATTPEQKHLLWEMYMDELASHHVSIYDPGQLSPFKVNVTGSRQSPWRDCTLLKDTPEPGKNAILVKDYSTTQNISSHYDVLLPIPEGGFTCSFRFKLPKPGKALFICRSFNGSDAWMPGCNKDTRLTGDENWQEVSVTLDSFKPEARKVSLSFLPHLYNKEGSNTGEMTVTDFVVKERATGKVLVDESSMKVSGPEDLKLVFDWAGWDRYVETAITKYHATTLRIPVGGLGGGNFRTRRAPTLFGYEEGSPEYAHLMPLYFGEIERHLREKGWLEKAYIYWFDEPDPKDYEFVMNGFGKLKKYAPGIRRLLTEQVEPELIGGPNLWCPHKNRTTREAVKGRQAQGDEYWWYISTACRAPFTGLFIDHPGTDLRVWLWQTWDYNVEGVLIWASNYWTSAAVYPNSLQNPYLDTMAWVPYEPRPFGNGDGRFIYPPESAADGSQHGFVADAPVGCYRLEMFRDGIEDYEYFVMLKKLLAAKGARLSEARRAEYEALLKVPAEVSASLTEYTASPAPVEAHRAKLARAIAELQ